MSHFTVAVICHDLDDVDILLEPFNEQTENIAYLEFNPASESDEEMIATYKEQLNAGKNYDSYEDFLLGYYGYHIDPKVGRPGYNSNPNAAWDWWQIGGRWSNMLKTKSNGRGNMAPIKDIDFTPDPDEYNRAIRFWEVVVEGQPLRDHESQDDFFSFYNAQYYIDQFGTKEKYAEDCAGFSTWAFLTPEGEWVEKGAMGWWGMNDATNNSRDAYKEAFKKALETYSDCWIVIVDCHI